MILTPLAQIGPDWLITWLTPLWILGLGALLGLALLLVAWVIVAIVARQWAAEIPVMIAEGPLLPISVVVLIFALFGILGGVFVHQPIEVIKSLPRFISTGLQAPAFEVPVAADDNDFTKVSLNYPIRSSELSNFKIVTDQPIILRRVDTDGQALSSDVDVSPGDDFEWLRGKESISPVGDGTISELEISNDGGTTAKVELTVETKPVYPQSITILHTAICVLCVYILYFLQQALFPKMSAISWSTCKSEMAQPLFLIILGLGSFLLFIFVFIPYNTFGEDIKMLKDSGFTAIMVLAIIHAIWAASNSVAEEIDGKTALTVLSKPVGRRQFVFGKFIGISWSVAVLFIVLGTFFVILVSYKPVYDARESSKLAPIWEESYVEVMRTVPGLVLAFMETVVLTSVSVAISTRLPLLANFAICFAVYTLGHLTPLLVQSAVGMLPPVAFMGIFISAVLPVLEAFNIQAAVAGGREVPYVYMAWALVYCCLYSLVAMLLALILFEDRDLA